MSIIGNKQIIVLSFPPYFTQNLMLALVLIMFLSTCQFLANCDFLFTLALILMMRILHRGEGTQDCWDGKTKPKWCRTKLNSLYKLLMLIFR